MSTESQSTYNSDANLIKGTSAYYQAQRLTITTRTVTSLSFWLRMAGSPSSVYRFKIWRASDSTILSNEQVGNPTEMGLTSSFQKITKGLTTPLLVNEEVRIGVEQDTGGSDPTNYVAVAKQSTDVKASEQQSYYTGSWTDDATQDLAYEYVYQDAPVVTTQTCTDVVGSTATGRGTLVSTDASVTEHGHCWDTATNPTTALSTKTTLGAIGVGATFKSSITGLTPGTGYYVRAYATSSIGTSYGINVYFVASTGRGGYLWMEGSNLRGFDQNAVERKHVHTDDVDDTPVNGATTDPISSNWAFDHEAATDPHTVYQLGSVATTTSQFDKTNDAALENITGLSISITTGKTYIFRSVLFVDANVTGGHQYAMSGTATGSAVKYQINSISNTTNLNVLNSRQTALGGAAGQAGATSIITEIFGTIVCNGTGTLTVQFAQNVATAATTSSVLTQSSLQVQEI